jgi:hypothetical protein
VVDRFNFLEGPGVTGLLSDSALFPEPFGAARPPDNGLGGKLAVRTPPRGGCGKALILIVFLMVFPASFTPGAVRSLGRVLPEGDDGMIEVEGARSPLFGRLGAASDLKSDNVGMAPVLLRVFVVGKAGRAVFGGP